MVRTTSLLTALLVVALVGCEQNSGNKVTGTVQYSDGTPVPSGQVRLSSANFETHGDIEEPGKVEFGKLTGGVPDGTYKVTVTAYSDGSGDDGDYGQPLVAQKYMNVETSGITVEVSGNTEVKIEVEKP